MMMFSNGCRHPLVYRIKRELQVAVAKRLTNYY